MHVTIGQLNRIREAVLDIGETSVTLATSGGVVTFDFSDPHTITARPLPFESQPSRQELAAMLPSRPAPLISQS